MRSNEVVLALGLLLSIAACDKKDNAGTPPTASAAAAPAASPGDMERRDREHGREEHADGGREHEHEERPK